MAEASIHFHNEDITFNLKNKSTLRSWITAALLKERKQPGEINFIFCSDDHLLGINQTYLNHDTLTDIITFDYSDDMSDGGRGTGDNERDKDLKSHISNLKSISGDIFISIDRIKENAEKFNTSFDNELHRVMIHGVLHLAGYKDKTKPDKTQMTEKEDFYLHLFEDQFKRKK
jgi:rRNA maturation RNase YbeY